MIVTVYWLCSQLLSHGIVLFKVFIPEKNIFNNDASLLLFQFVVNARVKHLTDVNAKLEEESDNPLVPADIINLLEYFETVLIR